MHSAVELTYTYTQARFPKSGCSLNPWYNNYTTDIEYRKIRLSMVFNIFHKNYTVRGLSMN